MFKAEDVCHAVRAGKYPGFVGACAAEALVRGSSAAARARAPREGTCQSGVAVAIGPSFLKSGTCGTPWPG